ncbi:MAG: BMP family ABC transporter substrate-binding protein [Oscillospiraceae bacterium]|nr:BMP family ABC transporter substrate-binding protein [Oscillospiraceae bacterium]
MKNKIFLVFSLCLCLILVLFSGCETQSKDTSGSTGKLFSAGLVSDTAGINDEAFNSSAWEGMLRSKEELGFDVRYLESRQEADYESNLDKMTDDELDVIFAVGYRLASAIENVASKNPDQSYVLLDSSLENPQENTLSISYNDQESSFMAGVISAYMTNTNKVAMITGGEGDVINRFRFGYESGVKFGAKDLGKNIEVEVQCINSFQDDSKGKAMANAMFAKGNDIIFTVAGNVGKGVIEAAKENNKYAIGVDRDQSYLAPDNVITSVMKFVNNTIYDVCKDIKSSNFETGSSKTVGLKEGAVGLASTTDKLVPEKVITKIEDIKQRIIDGDITPPFDKESFENFKY